ncbi:MAG: hypothetical protein ACXU8U_05925 [Asticcacaulis sp.]
MTAQSPFFRQMTSQAATGGFAILHGTLAPEGCVARLDGFDAEAFDGPARVFPSCAEAAEAIAHGRVRSCDVVIIRHDDSSDAIFASDGGMARVIEAVSAQRLERITLITDGRAGSSATDVAVIGNVAPNAAAGGPIAYVNDDDIIHIDIAGRRIDVLADIDIRKGARRKKTGFAPADRYAAMLQDSQS